MSTEARTPSDLADEYVLGLLDPADASAVEAAMEHDEALRKAVSASRDRFIELDLAGSARPVSDTLWTRIASSVGDGAPPGQDTAAGAARLAPMASNDNIATRWRRAAIGGIAASLVLAAGLAFTLLNQPEPKVVAVLMNDAGEPLVLVEDFGDASARITPLGDFQVPGDRSLQVWTLPTQEMGPVSLGLLDGWRSILLDGQTLPEPREEQLYEITLEEPGGSRTGRPTGPILVKGFAKFPK
jgi:anti-sigma-K factor RskA